MRKFPLAHWLALLLLCGLSPVYAQNMTQTVIGNAGDYFENNLFGNLHWTVGEIAVSQLENDIVLSEGFHQGYYELIVSTPELEAFDWSVKVFPNPTVERVRVEANEQFSGSAILYDNAGKQVLEQQIWHGQADIDFTRLPAGSYWLRLRSEHGQEQSFQIQKIRP